MEVIVSAKRRIVLKILPSKLELLLLMSTILLELLELIVSKTAPFRALEVELFLERTKNQKI